MSDLKTRFDITAIAAVIAADMASRLGQTVEATPSDISHSGDAQYCSLEIEQNFGAFAMVIAHADVNLRAEACEDGTIWVKADLRYKHHGGGSNGSTIGTWWVRDGAVENFRAN